MHISKKFNIILIVIASLLMVVLISMIVAFALSHNASDSHGSDDTITVTTTTEKEIIITDPIYTTAPPETDVPEPTTEKFICIDPGHGWGDNGCIAAFTDEEGNAVTESEINLAVALYMRDELVALGYNVVMLRESDDVIPASGTRVVDRVNYVNSRDDIALMFSIHCDTFSSSSVSGTRVYYRQDIHPSTASLGTLLRDAFSESGIMDKKVLLYPDGAPEGFYPLVASHSTSILVECGFLSNRSDFDHLTDPEYQQNFAKAMASAVDEYMRLTY